MTTATFQKGDRVEFKEFPEVAAVVSENVIRKAG